MVQPRTAVPVRGAPPPGPLTYEAFLAWADEGVVRSDAMPVNEAWLWQDPLPRVLSVLKR